MTEQEVIDAAGLVYQRKQIDEFLGLIQTLSAPDGLPLRFEISVKTHRGDYVASGRDKHIQVSALIAIAALREIRKFIGDRLAQMGIEPGQEPEPAKQDVFGLELDVLDLSVRSANALKSDNIVYIGDLVQKSAHELFRIPNFGRRSLNEVKEALAKMGLRLDAGMPGYIKPPDHDIAADYWVTRRRADAAHGYDIGLPDIRICCRWNGRDAWITGDHEGLKRREADLGCLHSNNGWRIEGRA